jgi:hypothetical protein
MYEDKTKNLTSPCSSPETCLPRLKAALYIPHGDPRSWDNECIGCQIGTARLAMVTPPEPNKFCNKNLHEMTPENTYFLPGKPMRRRDATGQCLQCISDKNKVWYKENKERKRIRDKERNGKRRGYPPIRWDDFIISHKSPKKRR